MFQLKQWIDFCYGHRLLNYAGKCRFLHGHNGRVEIVLSGTQLDERGMLVDFSDIKKSLRTWISSVAMLLCARDSFLPIGSQPRLIFQVIPSVSIRRLS